MPLVHKEGDSRKEQLLTCRANLPGFASCPPLRPLNETSSLICNPLRDNSKRCETTHEKIHTSCRVLEICDQAVILSGGWNRFSTLPYHMDNVGQIYRMLRNHGFKRRNIEIFFANGIKHGLEGMYTNTIVKRLLFFFIKDASMSARHILDRAY